MLANYQSAFKAYDIRGIYWKEIDEHFSYIMGKAIWSYFSKNFNQKEKFLIASDVRTMNNHLIQYFEMWTKETNPNMQIEYAAFRNENISEKEYTYGICSSSVAYYLWSQDYALSVIFTASHNPPEYAGMKFFFKDVRLFPTKKLWEIFQKNYETTKKFQKQELKIVQPPKTLFDKKENLIKKLYKKREKISQKYHFIVDFSNWAGVSIEKEFFEKIKQLWHKIEYINDTPDGNFSAHLSETQDEKNYKQLIQKVQTTWADFGLMFDGDVDRIWIVTNNWTIMSGDLTSTIIAKNCIEESQEDSPTILYEVMSTKTIPETVKKLWWKTKLVRVGRFFINQYLRETKWIFAGESSWHFLFKEMWYHEMPPIALYFVIKELSQHKDSESMLHNFQKYYKCPIISIKNIDKEKAIQAIQKNYSQYEQKTIDGISVFADNFRFNMRASNTEPKIKFTLEADTLEIMEIEKNKLEKLLRSLK